MVSTTVLRRVIDNSNSEGMGAALVERVGAVKVFAAPDTNGGGGSDGGKEMGEAKTSAGEDKKETELERRRQERAAQIEAK